MASSADAQSVDKKCKHEGKGVEEILEKLGWNSIRDARDKIMDGMSADIMKCNLRGEQFAQY